jgi:hypothetical protein
MLRTIGQQVQEVATAAAEEVTRQSSQLAATR